METVPPRRNSLVFFISGASAALALWLLSLALLPRTVYVTQDASLHTLHLDPSLPLFALVAAFLLASGGLVKHYTWARLALLLLHAIVLVVFGYLVALGLRPIQGTPPLAYAPVLTHNIVVSVVAALLFAALFLPTVRYRSPRLISRAS